MGNKRLKVNQGDRYGKFTIIKEVEEHITNGGNKHRMALCHCECGNEKTVKINALRQNVIVSCGCYRKEKSKQIQKQNFTTHNCAHHPLYKTWMGMKQRCMNQNSATYKYYGGRGIKICDRWLESFHNFIEDMGQKPIGYSLDRINNDGNYEPNNCKWATKVEQNKNRRKYQKKEVTLELRMQEQ